VLALGAIENARLLLASNTAEPGGLGNRHDLVGRYFMEHPHLPAGELVLWGSPEVIGLYRYHQDPQLRHTVLAALCPSEQLQRQEELLNLSVELRPTKDEPDSEPPWDVPAAARRTDEIAGRSAPTAGLVPVMLKVRSEQTPIAESRVALSEVSDALGQPRATLDWRLLPEDRIRIRRAVRLVAREIGLSALGRGREIWREAEPWWETKVGNHHLGTTRMHPDPRHGVVDADCRVHGTSNLFVTTSSVFPTGGFANPVLTIVALALRLADHLKLKLAGTVA
jgi:choline dehydrogenase-like flavoprotein